MISKYETGSQIGGPEVTVADVRAVIRELVRSMSAVREEGIPEIVLSEINQIEGAGIHLQEFEYNQTLYKKDPSTGQWQRA